MDELTAFCPQCFATSEDGSWGQTSEYIDYKNNYCSNCGLNGAIIQISKWAASEIRKSASWVGKRYYPDQEDKDIKRELFLLRSMTKDFPGRKVEGPDMDNFYTIIQEQSSGRKLFISGKFQSKDEAFEWAKTRLPYYTEEQLNSNE